MTQFATREDWAANDLEAWRLANAEEAEHRAARMNAKQRHVEMMITALDAKVQQLEQLAYCQSVLLAEQAVKIAKLEALERPRAAHNGINPDNHKYITKMR